MGYPACGGAGRSETEVCALQALPLPQLEEELSVLPYPDLCWHAWLAGLPGGLAPCVDVIWAASGLPRQPLGAQGAQEVNLARAGNFPGGGAGTCRQKTPGLGFVPLTLKG